MFVHRAVWVHNFEVHQERAYLASKQGVFTHNISSSPTRVPSSPSVDAMREYLNVDVSHPSLKVKLRATQPTPQRDLLDKTVRVVTADFLRKQMPIETGNVIAKLVATEGPQEDRILFHIDVGDERAGIGIYGAHRTLQVLVYPKYRGQSIERSVLAHIAAHLPMGTQKNLELRQGMAIGQLSRLIGAPERITNQMESPHRRATVNPLDPFIVDATDEAYATALGGLRAIAELPAKDRQQILHPRDPDELPPLILHYTQAGFALQDIVPRPMNGVSVRFIFDGKADTSTTPMVH